MKRISKKTAPVGTYYTHEEAAAVAQIVVAAQIQLEALTAKRDAAVLKVVDRFTGEMDQASSEIKHGMAALEAFAGANPELFAKAESILLAGHRVGYRVGQPQAKTKPRFTWAKVIEAIREAGPAFVERYIRTKEDVNKEAIIQDREDAATLDKLGVQVIQEQRFYLDPAREGQQDKLLTQ